MNNEFKIADVLEQRRTFDSKWTLPFSGELLMKIINGEAADSDDEIAEMENPKDFIVRVIIQTREV